MKFKPLQNRVLVRPLPEEEKTRGGIVLVEHESKDHVVKGEIMAVGEGINVISEQEGVPMVLHIPMTVKEGDIVVYGRHESTKITIDDEAYLLMKETDIAAIV